MVKRREGEEIEDGLINYLFMRASSVSEWTAQTGERESVCVCERERENRLSRSEKAGKKTSRWMYACRWISTIIIMNMSVLVSHI